MSWTGPLGPETDELVQQLEAKGVKLDLRGEKFEVDCPAQVLTPDLLEELRERRLDLIAFLNGDRSRGFRRLPDGRVAWLPSRPWEARGQTQAITDWQG